MERAALGWADWVSLSRIPLALIFVALFEASPSYPLVACIVIALLAQLSDHLDGYLARRAGRAGTRGWLIDSIADRGFYLAALLAFAREYGLSDVLVWLFVQRETCVYAFWIALGDFEENWRGFWLLGHIHAGIVRLAIILGCLLPYWFAPAAIREDGLLILTVLLAVATAFGYVCLALLMRGRR